MQLDRSILLALFVLEITSMAARAATIECRTGETEKLAGAAVHSDTRFSTPAGLTVVPPTVPDGWVIRSCASRGVYFSNNDPRAKVSLTATADQVMVGRWRDEKTFEDAIVGRIASGASPTRHVSIDSVTAMRIDDRHCFEVRSSSTLEAAVKPGAAPGAPVRVQEFIRACHLQDQNQPEAAVLVWYARAGAQSAPDFDGAAKAFADGVTLPSKP